MKSSSATEDFDGSARPHPEAAIVVNTSLIGEPDTVPSLPPLLVDGLSRALIDSLSRKALPPADRTG
jgi:hypothetical protein